jgi:hypothetical protein
LNRQQQRLRSQITRDTETLSKPFAAELMGIFERLGVMASASYRKLVEPKEFGDDPATDASAVADDMAIAAVQSSFVAAGANQYRLVAQRVFQTVNATFNLSIGMPDILAQEILAAGGTRMGLVDLDKQTRQALLKVIEQARAEGLDIPAIARRIRSKIPAGRYTSTQIRAKVIARTETKNAQRESTVRAYKQSGKVERVIIIDDILGHGDADCTFWNRREVTLAQARELSAQEHPNGTRDFVPIIA